MFRLRHSLLRLKKKCGGNELNWLKNKKAKCAGQGNIHSL